MEFSGFAQIDEMLYARIFPANAESELMIRKEVEMVNACSMMWRTFWRNGDGFSDSVNVLPANVSVGDWGL